MTMDALELVFFADETTQAEELQKLQLLLCCNAPQQEDWLKSQLPNFEEAGRAKNLTELKKILKNADKLDLAILLRKNGAVGVDRPEEMAKVILEHSPHCLVFIIVGSKDRRGMEIIQVAEELGCRTLSAEGKPIVAADIQKEVKELSLLIQERRIPPREEPKEVLHVIEVEGSKGGCGVTMALCVVAQLLKETTGEPTYILEQSGGCAFHKITEKGIILLKRSDPLPTRGWLLIEGPADSLEQMDGQSEQHLLIVEPSAESFCRAKKKMRPQTWVIVNRAEADVLPNAVYTAELSIEPRLIIPYRPDPYIATDWEKITPDWKPLLGELMHSE
jgi:hypothetical protein